MSASENSRSRPSAEAAFIGRQRHNSDENYMTGPLKHAPLTGLVLKSKRSSAAQGYSVAPWLDHTAPQATQTVQWSDRTFTNAEYDQFQPPGHT